METLLKVLSRRHVPEILEALMTRQEKGLTYTEIQYNVVKSSGTSLLLKSMMEYNLVTTEENRYRITKTGVEAIELTRSLLTLKEEEPHSGDHDHSGEKRRA